MSQQEVAIGADSKAVLEKNDLYRHSYAHVLSTIAPMII